MNNYFNFVKTIKSISLANGLVNETGEGDIYTHLNSGVHKYPCVFLTVENIVNTTNDTMRINGTLFYVDRLCDNEANKVEVQSNGITILQQIIDKISEETVWTLTANVFTPFTEKFSDMCAGQFVSFTVDMPNEIVCSSSEYEIKTIELTKNGLYDVTGYDKALVNVITRWGDIEGNIEEQTDLIDYINSHTVPVEWGNITGNIENQTDLVNLIQSSEYDDTELRNAISQEITDRQTADEAIAASIKNPIIINYGDTSWTYDKVMEKINAGYVVIVYYAPYNEFYYCYRYTETIITFYNNLNLLFQDINLYRLRYCQLHKNTGWGIYVFRLQGELPAIPDVVDYGEDTYQETLRKLNDIAKNKVVYCRKHIDLGDNENKIIFGVPQFNLDDEDVMYGNPQFIAIDSDTNKLIIMEVDENDNWETTEVTFQYKLNAGNGITINQNSNTISCNAATIGQAGIAKLYNSMISTAQDGGITPNAVSRALQSYQPLLGDTGHIHISKNTSGGLSARFVDKERPIIVGRAIPCKTKKYFTNDGLLTDAGKLAFSYLSGSRYLVSGNMLKIVCDSDGVADEIYETIRAEYPNVEIFRSDKITPSSYTCLIRVKINSTKMPIVRMPFFNYETTTVTSYVGKITDIISDICEGTTNISGCVRWANKSTLNFDKTASPYVTVSQGIIRYNKPIHVYKPQSRTLMDNRYTNLVPPLNIVRALYNLPNYTQHSRMLCCDVNSNIDYQTLPPHKLWFALYRKFDIRILRKKIHKYLRTEGTVTYSKSFIRPGGSSVSGNKLNALASRTQHSGLWRIALKWKRNRRKISSQAIRLTLRVDTNEPGTRLLYKCNLVS